MRMPQDLRSLVSALVLCCGAGLSSASPALAQSTCPALAGRDIFFLTSDNTVYRYLNPPRGGVGLIRQARISGIDGNAIGFDARVADKAFYVLTDTGKIYTLNLADGSTTLVSTLGARFSGGSQSLMDFNPVANALRVIGSNDQNLAVVNNGGNLNRTVAQTALSYAAGDGGFGVDPNITAGAYSNNVAGAAQTLFYMIDYDLDTLVTIADLTAAGSSNTAGGKLKTIGAIVDPQGRPINFTATAGLDIYAKAGGGDVAVATNGAGFYCIDLSAVNASLPAGTVQNVVAAPVFLQRNFPPRPSDPPTGAFLDVLVTPPGVGIPLPPGVGPIAPFLFATAFDPDAGRINLECGPTDGVESRLESSANGGPWKVLTLIPASGANFGTPFLDRGTTYTFRLVARNAAGDESPSNQVTVTTNP